MLDFVLKGEWLSFQDLMNKFTTPLANISEVVELPSPINASLDSFINRFTGVTESYFFYGKTVELKFSIEDHIYYLVDPVLGNLTEVNGVTNTCHIINASEMLVPWSAKVAIAKLLRLVPTETVDGVLRIQPIPFDQFTTIALEAKSAHKDKLDEASDIGHMAHKCLEDSITYAIANDPERIVRSLIKLPEDERALNAATGAKSWMDQHNVRWIETETKIYSKEHNYAGTMDGLATCDSCQDKSCCPEAFKDRLSLIDWKSSNYLKIEYLFQTASYQHAKQEELGIEIVDRWILRLGKNEEEAGKFEPWHMVPSDFAEDFEGFLCCLRLTRIVDTVNERMKTQKKSIRAFKKEMREAAKLIAKEKAALQKALDKAEAKRLKEIEKEKTKAEAKVKREADKAAKKAGLCTSTSADQSKIITQLDSTCPDTEATLEPSMKSPITPQESQPQPESTTSTEVMTKLQSCPIEATSTLKYEEEVQQKPFALPEER